MTQRRLQDLGDTTQDTKSENVKRTFIWKDGHVWKAGYYTGCFRCGEVEGMAVCVSLTWKTGDELEASFVIIASYVHEEEEMSEQETSSGQFYHSGRIP